MHDSTLDPIAADWAKDLFAAPSIVEILGRCAAHASKPEIVRVKLDDPKLPYTYNIGKDGGDIDVLMDSYGKPSQQMRFQRALRSLNRQVEKTEAKGCKTLEVFKMWRESSSVLRFAVDEGLGMLKDKVDEREKRFQDAQEEMNIAKRNTDNAQKQFEESQTRASRALTRAEELKVQAKTILNFALNINFGAKKSSALNVLALANPVTQTLFVAAALTGLIYEIYALDARNAEARMEERARYFEDCERGLESQKELLELTQASKMTWGEIVVVVNGILNELKSLQKNVTEKVSYFNRISLSVTDLVESYEEKIREVVEEGDTEANSLNDLRQHSNVVKVLALMVHTMAKLYSTVASTYIAAGFQRASQLPNYMTDNVSKVDEQMTKYLEDLRQYTEDAKQGIANLVYKAKCDLWEDLKRLCPDLTDESALNPQNGDPPSYYLVDPISNEGIN
ncbi:hypothetical protein ABW20_dc0110716 [Dactylellina cionopaga]|nr:hypothetical protein ABW20_dc0110716 [Dactylellina cionopaga]